MRCESQPGHTGQATRPLAAFVPQCVNQHCFLFSLHSHLFNVYHVQGTVRRDGAQWRADRLLCTQARGGRRHVNRQLQYSLISTVIMEMPLPSSQSKARQPTQTSEVHIISFLPSLYVIIVPYEMFLFRIIGPIISNSINNTSKAPST